ncbi:helix-turn-helix domain-containing protein [Streptomyces kaniharaensis]|uniref:Helix-turn-helix domain-containing protein n=1 Tax=Streptomyces kaniharaensis TaxID=212423 RepID=A0A6N7L2R9_9ACTN|nr:helix-turn-helix domain-containing protein [Streptomyces kaniharaensis]MQS18087.1 helix-turn-helix domain-containing protein [Streptomyces kaniharaensis]MQS18100.1 helix-turn-helix domain-containing protein [Streptomyces kaniharaensis]
MERPRFSLKDAAAACGVSVSTIRRYREGGRFPGAEKVDSGWLIPLEDLLAAGLRVNAPSGPDEQPVSGVSDLSEGERARLLRELADARHAQALAEADARHLRDTVTRQDAHLGDLRRAMLALTAGPASTPEPAQEPALSDAHEHPVSVPEQPRSRWWARGR